MIWHNKMVNWSYSLQGAGQTTATTTTTTRMPLATFCLTSSQSTRRTESRATKDAQICDTILKIGIAI